MRIEIDSRQVDLLAVDISRAPGRVQRNASSALRTRVGPKLAREMKIDASGHRGNWFGQADTEYVTPTPRTSSELLDAWTVEAGVNSGGSGSLMHILAYGSVNNAAAYDPGAGPRRALPLAEKWLADAAEDSVLGDER